MTLPRLRALLTAVALVGALVAALVLNALAAPSASVPESDGVTVVDRAATGTTDATSFLAGGALGKVAVPRAGYGFSDGAKLAQMSVGDLRRQLDAVARTDARWLRVPVNWGHVESVQGTYDWSQVDRVVREARKRDLTVLANISYAPTWARAPGSSPTAPPRSARAYGRFAGDAAQHLAGKVRHWELWNEPNLTSHYGGPAYLARAPETYTRLVKSAYRALNAQDRRSVVVAGSLAAAITNDQGYKMPTFVRRMYAAGAGKFFDAISLHPYTTPTQSSWERVYGDVDAVRLLMERQGHSRRQVWFTEIGHSTAIGATTQAQQAELLVRALGAAARRRYVGPAFLYAIRDSGTDRGVFGQNFGTLLTFDFQPKQTARVLRKRGR
jgi:polysaccharide biosynthesis protein PslG